MNVNIRIKSYLPLAFLACSGFALEQPENDLLLEQKQDTPQLHVGGHLSQSFLKTENNNYLHEDSMDGTFDMNEFALNVSGDLGKNVFLNSQLIVRNAMEDSGIDIDFANVDLHLNENTSLLIGKNNMPLGWFNQSLDSSHSNPFIVAPLGVYSPGFHETIVSAWGLGVDHSRALGKGYFLDAEMALGTSSIDSDSDFMRESKFQEEHLALSTSQAVINALGGPPTTVDRVSLQNYEAKIKQRLATRLVLRTPMNLKFGLRQGGTRLPIAYDHNHFANSGAGGNGSTHQHGGAFF